MTGLRRGELVALRWQDIDWQAGVLRIQQALVRVKDHAIGQSHLVFQEPKTEHSRRTIPLPEMCLTALRRHRAQQTEHNKLRRI
jgi:integrase